jgi:hypothetical protein
MATKWALAGLICLTAASLALAGNNPVPAQQGTAPQSGTAPIQGEAPHQAQRAKCGTPSVPAAAPLPFFHQVKPGTKLTCNGTAFQAEGRQLGLESKAFYNGQLEEYDRTMDNLNRTVPTQPDDCMNIINVYLNARDRAYDNFKSRQKMEVSIFERRCGER